jgi:hypothetical protein
MRGTCKETPFPAKCKTCSQIIAFVFTAASAFLGQAPAVPAVPALGQKHHLDLSLHVGVPQRQSTKISYTVGIIRSGWGAFHCNT